MGQANISPILQEFILESHENIGVISSSITALEKNPEDKERINELYRAVHTIKGGAGFLKFKRLETLTHNFENVLELVRSEKISFESKFADLFLSCLDAIQLTIHSLEETATEPEESFDDLVIKLLGLIELANTKHSIVTDSRLNEKIGSLNEKIEKAKDIKSYTITDEEPEEIKNTIPAESKEEKSAQALLDETVKKIKQEKTQESHIAEQKSELKPKVKQTKVASKTKQSEKPEASPKAKESNIADSVVRVNVNLLDKIMNVVGELVLTRNQILQYASGEQSAELQRLSNQLNVITTELQSDVMTTRMQPIGSVLSRFERIVRDMAKDLGKSIELKIDGKATELDKTLLEAIKDPLTHMIRNSVDHGIETPEVRLANGKPEQGCLHINAYHEGGQVSIEINDDGGGISKDKVKQKAIDKGLISEEKAEELTDKEILNMIFMPGFSTAAQVTNISGRGVGMDVVRTNIEKIGGKIDIFSEEGKGTSFKLKIPLTLAIIPALIVESAGASFAIPQINLLELVRLNKMENEIETIEESEFFRLRGDLIPLFRLSSVLGLTDDKEESHSENIAVLNADGKVYGLVVDSILDTVEIVVKPLSQQLKDLNYYAGATIMGDGRVSLILDVNGIAADNKLNTETKTLGFADQHESTEEAHEVLLFELFDKGEDLFAFPLILVNRLEQFRKESVEFSGEQAIIHYRGKPMPLLFLQSELGFSDPVKSMADVAEQIDVIVVELRGENYGFVVREIIDISSSFESVDDKIKDRNGIVGTLFIGGKTASVIDIFSIVNASRLRSNLKDSLVENTDSSKIEVSSKKILVVEDSPMFRAMAVKIVKDLGYEVEEARDGLEALNYLNKNSDIDIVLSDIEMPQMNGWELCENIKASKELSNLPVIALTTRFSPKDIEKGKEIGFDFYLEKMKKEDIAQALQKIEAIGA